MPRAKGGAAGRRADNGRVLARLFPDCPEDQLYAGRDAWPPLEGALAILFASRSGSTFLAREIESRYRLGQIGESFNPPQLKARAERAGGLASPADAARAGVRTLGEAGWFGVKMGAQTLGSAERMGFVAAYRDKLYPVLLFRRDLVAQAVSSVKAEITGRFHSNQAETRAAGLEDYDHARILAKAHTMLRGMETLDRWVRACGRPWKKLFYEDFAGGDFASAIAACGAFGLPARDAPARQDNRAVTRIGDDVNAQWSLRFRREYGDGAEEILARYERLTLTPP